MNYSEAGSPTCLELCIQLGKQLYKWFDRRLRRMGLTPVQLEVLAALRDSEALTMSEIRERLCCAGGNVTAVVARMAQAGWVERQPGIEDRRVGLVRITPAGREQLASATDTPRCCPEAAEWLTPQEWAELERLLTRILAALAADAQASSRKGNAMDIKQAVKKRYAEMAQAKGGCCGSGGRRKERDPQTAALIGYRQQELEAIPEAANLGLGCGNPLALAEAKPGDTVLDLGSGAGIDCFLAARQVGPQGRVIGVDMTEEMIARARENVRQAGLENVDFRLGEIEHLPVEDESVDLVISNCVINLVPDKGRAFREIARVLKPGGKVMVSDIIRRGELPAALLQDPETYVACVGGAIEADDYLGLMRAAGLVEARILSQTDAAELLAAAPADVKEMLPEAVTVDQLRGKVFSANVRARKPEG